MSFNIIRYEFDPDANNPNNLVRDELHTLEPRPKRIVIPNDAPFYTSSVVITDRVSGRQLTDRDFKPIDFSASLQWLTGKEVAHGLVIENSAISNNIAITYRVVGGQYGNNTEVLRNQIQTLFSDNRRVRYADILGKPDGFAPVEHMHDVGDVFGFEYVVYALDRIRQAIEMGDEASHAAIYDYINDQLKTKIGQVPDRAYITNELDKLNRLIANNKKISDKAETDLSELIKALQRTVANNKVSSDNADSAITSTIATLQQTDRTLNTSIGNIDRSYKTAVADLDRAYKAAIVKERTYTDSVKSALNTSISKLDKAYKDADIALSQRVTQLSKDVDNKVKAEASRLDAFKTLMLDRSNKLNEDRIPISTAVGNLIRYQGNGLYYGIIPEPPIANIYIDPDLGVDEKPTVENKRGTRDKPLKSIAFALAQGSPGVSRNIYLAEGKLHRIGTRPRRWRPILNNAQFNMQYIKSSAAADYDTTWGYGPDNFGAINARGGSITFRPYGPRTDSIIAGLRPGLIWGAEKQIRDLNTRIEFQGWRINLKRPGDYNSGLWLDFMTLSTSTTMLTDIIFYGISLQRIFPPKSFMDEITKQPNFDMASFRACNYANQQNFSFSLYNCNVKTGDKFTYVQGGQTKTYNCPFFDIYGTGTKASLNWESGLINGAIDETLCLNGENYLANVRTKIESSINMLRVNWFTGDLRTKYISNTRNDGFNYSAFTTNLVPPRNPRFDFNPIVYEGGKIYALDYRSDGRHVRTQIFPATWS